VSNFLKGNKENWSFTLENPASTNIFGGLGSF